MKLKLLYLQLQAELKKFPCLSLAVFKKQQQKQKTKTKERSSILKKSVNEQKMVSDCFDRCYMFGVALDQCTKNDIQECHLDIWSHEIKKKN